VTRRSNLQSVPNQSAADDVESSETTWTTSGDPSRELAWVRVERSATEHHWWVSEPGTIADYDQSLISPPLQIRASGEFLVEFRHRFDMSTVPADGSPTAGGVIEISKDAGVTWTTVRGVPGYTGTFSLASSTVRGFTGRSAGYPEFKLESVPLGSGLAGQTVRLRFRAGGWSPWSPGHGWEVDDIRFGNLVNLPFAALVRRGSTCLQAPVASAGAAQAVNAGVQVLLDGSGSADPGHAPLSYDWAQVSGPVVTLSDAAAPRPAFTAPSLTSASTVVLALKVSNGTLWSTPSTVSITVAPRASDPPPQAPPSSSGGGCSSSGSSEGGMGLLLPIAAVALSLWRRRR
jgi:uncharacterized protein (TIGR03382 family)